MSNRVEWQLDVLASSPAEVDAIESALQEPCEELLAWVAKGSDGHPQNIVEWVKDLVTFKATRNLGSGNSSRNKKRRFANSTKDHAAEIVLSHLDLVSRTFPDAIFLLDYWDIMTSYAGKCVTKGGQEIRQVHDVNQQAQGYEWVLPDIFAPYRPKHETDVPFGLYWDAWVLDTEKAFAQLKERYGIPTSGTTCESALLD